MEKRIANKELRDMFERLDLVGISVGGEEVGIALNPLKSDCRGRACPARKGRSKQRPFYFKRREP